MRITANPNADWSVQASWAGINEPERLHSGIDVVRFTASAMHNRRLPIGNWQTTLVWGRNKRKAPLLQNTSANNFSTTHVHNLNSASVSDFGSSTTRLQSAILVESAIDVHERHRFFSRLEWAEKDELFRPSDPRHSTIYNILKWNLGYGWSVVDIGGSRVTIGAALALNRVPEELLDVYGSSATSYTFFLRFEL